MSISGFPKTTIGGISPSNPLPVNIIGGGNDLSVLIIEDSTGTKYLRREVIDESGVITISYENFDGSAATPIAPITVTSMVLPIGASTSAKQDELRGTQGTGASYDPPTGGSGVFGWLSGIYKEIVSGIKLKHGGSDVSSSNPIPIFSVSGTGQTAEAVMGHEWIAEYYCAAVAAKYSKIAFLNPVGSGKKILFFTASGGHSSAATITYYAKKIAGAGGGGITGMTLLTKNEQNIANNNVSKMEVYYSNEDALSSNFQLSRTPVTSVYPVIQTCVVITNPIAVLSEGEALLFEHGTVNFGMYIKPLFVEFNPLALT